MQAILDKDGVATFRITGASCVMAVLSIDRDVLDCLCRHCHGATSRHKHRGAEAVLEVE